LPVASIAHVHTASGRTAIASLTWLVTANPTRERQVQSLFVAVSAQLGQPFPGRPRRRGGPGSADRKFGVGDLAERLLGEPDVVGGDVASGVAGSQHPSQRGWCCPTTQQGELAWGVLWVRARNLAFNALTGRSATKV
jgi:hypothetical protein